MKLILQELLLSSVGPALATELLELLGDMTAPGAPFKGVLSQRGGREKNPEARTPWRFSLGLPPRDLNVQVLRAGLIGSDEGKVHIRPWSVSKVVRLLWGCRGNGLGFHRLGADAGPLSQRGHVLPLHMYSRFTTPLMWRHDYVILAPYCRSLRSLCGGKGVLHPVAFSACLPSFLWVLGGKPLTSA